MISRSEGEQLVATMQDGWNAADAARFAQVFAEDADFVTVAGMHAHGRPAIAANHDRIFQTIYKASRAEMRVDQFRTISDGTAVMHVGATLQIPHGPFAGTMNALMTVVVSQASGSPEIVALHNTIVRDLAQAAGLPGSVKETNA